MQLRARRHWQRSSRCGTADTTNRHDPQDRARHDGAAMNSKGKIERLKAYHEAGHAVVARTLGITLSYVTMLPTDDMPAGGALGNSVSWLARDTDQATRLAAIEKDMKACLAGPHAQKRYQPRKNKRTPNEWASDFNLAKSLVARVIAFDGVF